MEKPTLAYFNLSEEDEKSVRLFKERREFISNIFIAGFFIIIIMSFVTQKGGYLPLLLPYSLITLIYYGTKSTKFQKLKEKEENLKKYHIKLNDYCVRYMLESVRRLETLKEPIYQKELDNNAYERFIDLLRYLVRTKRFMREYNAQLVASKFYAGDVYLRLSKLNNYCIEDLLPQMWRFKFGQEIGYVGNNEEQFIQKLMPTGGRFFGNDVDYKSRENIEDRETKRDRINDALDSLEKAKSKISGKKISMDIKDDLHSFFSAIDYFYKTFPYSSDSEADFKEEMHQFDRFVSYGQRLVERIEIYEKANKANKIIVHKYKFPDIEGVDDMAGDEDFEEENYNNKERKFIGRKIDFEKLNKLNTELGLKGELAIVDYEKELLSNAGRADLAKKVEHVSKTQGDGTGYDILSYSPNGDVKYIEVKTTKNTMGAGFTLTGNELAFMEQNPDEIYLYRIFNFDKEDRFGELHILSGYDEILEGLDIRPSQYNANII